MTATLLIKLFIFFIVFGVALDFWGHPYGLPAAKGYTGFHTRLVAVFTTLVIVLVAACGWRSRPTAYAPCLLLVIMITLIHQQLLDVWVLVVRWLSHSQYVLLQASSSMLLIIGLFFIFLLVAAIVARWDRWKTAFAIFIILILILNLLLLLFLFLFVFVRERLRRLLSRRLVLELIINNNHAGRPSRTSIICFIDNNWRSISILSSRSFDGTMVLPSLLLLLPTVFVVHHDHWTVVTHFAAGHALRAGFTLLYHLLAWCTSS